MLRGYEVLKIREWQLQFSRKNTKYNLCIKNVGLKFCLKLKDLSEHCLAFIINPITLSLIFHHSGFFII